MPRTNEELLDALDDNEAMYLTIIGEARGERVEGQIAVANVIMNRVQIRNLAVKYVCFQRLQFSCWNLDDPNRTLLERLAEDLLADNHDNNDYKQIQWIVDGVLDHKLDDNTNKADHYMTTKLFNSQNRPSWARTPTSHVVIGNHTFLTV